MNTSQNDLSIVRQLILRSLYIGKWILRTIWTAILLGIAASTLSTWLTSKKFDLAGTPLGWMLQNLILVLLLSFCFLLFTCLIWIVSFFIERDSSWLYTAKEKERSRLRRLFSTHIEHEIERISIQEDWKDYQFAELEAEVEAEGRQKGVKILTIFDRGNNRLRREKSLSEALRKSNEKIVLVEGDPGSGKSVALRHVALEMAKQAKSTQNTESVVPIYVNMKLIERKNGEEINRDFIEAFIVKTLMRSNDRDVRRFLDQEFQNGLRDNTLYFLFDSFDEIPDILNSTEADDMVNSYGEAIDDFLHGTNQCRGVIASRFYRGPRRLGWTHFRILPLSENRQLELIRKTNLVSKAKWVIGQLGNANQNIRSTASNPFFLALLCKYLERSDSFPENVHLVYETYIKQRFIDDDKEIKRSFQLDTVQVRTMAEDIAFCMTASESLGLNPTRIDLQNALVALDLPTVIPLDEALNALEYMKLARPDTGTNTSVSKSFTFSHRRFQEYFATCFVLRETSSSEAKYIAPEQLLTQGSWRETAVVLCQTQRIEQLMPLMREAEQILTKFCEDIPNLIKNPSEYILNEDNAKTSNSQVLFSRFPWPVGLFHLLSLLQEGCTNRLTEIPITIRTLVDKLVLSATEKRTREDKKWALEVAGVASENVLEYLLNEAFLSNSRFLKEVAYRQVARLSKIPPSIHKGMRYALIGLAASGRLYQERRATETYLRRLSQAVDFLSEMQLLLWLPIFDSITTSILILMIMPIAFSQFQLYYFHQNSQLVTLACTLLLVLICFPTRKYIWSAVSFFNDLNGAIKNINQSFFGAIGVILKILLLAIECFFTIILYLFLIIFVITLPLYKYNINLDIFVLSAMSLTSITPFALLATIFNKFTQRRWWILLPLWPILFFILHAPLIFKKIFNRDNLLRIRRVLSSLFLPITIITLIAFFVYSNHHVFEEVTALFKETLELKFVDIMVKILFFTVGFFALLIELFIILICALFMLSIPYIFYRSIYTEIKFVIWKWNFRGSVSYEELKDIFVKHQKLEEFLIRVLRFVRERKALEKSQETMRSVALIAFKIEKKQYNRKRSVVSYKLSSLASYFDTFTKSTISIRTKWKLLKKLPRRIRIQNIVRRVLDRKHLSGEKLMLFYAGDNVIDELYDLLNELRSSL